MSNQIATLILEQREFFKTLLSVHLASATYDIDHDEMVRDVNTIVDEIVANVARALDEQ